MVDHTNRDRLMWTRLDTRRWFTDGEPRGTHITLADDPLARMVFGYFVRTCHRAVLAAEALVIQMLDDARDRVLFVSVDWARDHARRLDTMMACGRNMLHHR